MKTPVCFECITCMSAQLIATLLRYSVLLSALRKKRSSGIEPDTSDCVVNPSIHGTLMPLEPGADCSKVCTPRLCLAWATLLIGYLPCAQPCALS